MNNNPKHIDPTPLPPQHEELFKKIDVPFSKSKEEIWESLAKKLDGTQVEKPKGKQVFLAWKSAVAIAAMLLLTVGVFFFLKSTTVETLAGQQLSHTLPDGSVVTLNAGTSIAYRPNFWAFNREVQLEGEAYFEVQKGKNFAVVSSRGTTEVLGTSFNIYARKDEYEVFCKTGKVRVSKDEQKEVLTPGEKVVLAPNHSLIKTIGVVAKDVLFWTEGKLKFRSRAFPFVIDELERQYDVNIELKSDVSKNLIYTGYFSKDKEIDAVLEMMALSLNLKLEKTSKQKYYISSNE